MWRTYSAERRSGNYHVGESERGGKFEARRGVETNFWKDMIDGGSTVTRITTESGNDARALVRTLLKNKPISTRLQEELHSGKSIVQTDAGTEIREEMRRLGHRPRVEHEYEMTELRDAQRAREYIFHIPNKIHRIYVTPTN